MLKRDARASALLPLFLLGITSVIKVSDQDSVVYLGVSLKSNKYRYIL